MGDADGKIGGWCGKIGKDMDFFVYFNLILYATWTKIEDDWG
jgi:hypothetical protein